MTDVRSFVTSYLRAIGAGAQSLPTGALAVRWPPTHAARFGGAMTIAFDPLVAEASGAELCVVGSDLLDRIVADASGRGFHCVARVTAENEPPADDVLAANLKFPNARPSILAADRGLVPYLLFNFRVALVTDEKRELVKSVLLNAKTLEVHSAADVFLQDSLTIPEERNVSEANLAAAYGAACGALERAILRDVEPIRAKASAVLATELERINRFYDTSIQELYAGRAQAPLETEKVFRAERDRRVDEAGRKYAFNVTAKLVNARTILIPTTSLRLRLANERSSKDLDLEFDAINLETNRPSCDSCHTTTDVVYLCSRGHVACDACDRTCSFCDHVVCSTCAGEVLSQCEACIRKACPDHTFQDEIGRKTYCPDHIHACAICGRMVGPPYVKACGLCGQSYCAVDVEASGRCRTCRTLAAIPATHADVARATAGKGEPKNLTKWVRGENGKYTVLVGKGAIFQYLYVLDKGGATIRREKGVRLLGG